MVAINNPVGTKFFAGYGLNGLSYELVVASKVLSVR